MAIPKTAALLTGIVSGELLNRIQSMTKTATRNLLDQLSVRVVISEPNLKEWIKDWAHAELMKKKTTKVFSASATDAKASHGDSRPPISVAPKSNSNLFWWNRLAVWITTGVDREKGIDDKGKIFDKGINAMTITIFAGTKNDVEDFLNFIRDAQPNKFKEAQKNITIYLCQGSGWNALTTISHRPKDSVIYDGDKLDRLRNDMNTFKHSRKRYTTLGVPYRRGYLLYGEPGNGKTSALVAMASDLGMDIGLIDMTEMNDNNLRIILTATKSNMIIVLEDVDCILPSRNSGKKPKKPSVEDMQNMSEEEAADFLGSLMGSGSTKKGGVTFSGLLNALDGVFTAEGRIIFMTTNHREKLDPALIRPGRIDYEVYVGNATANQLERMFLKFFPRELQASKEFAGKVPEGIFSMAEVQKWLLTTETPLQAILGLPDLLSEKGFDILRDVPLVTYAEYIKES